MAVEYSFDLGGFYNALQKMKDVNFESGNTIHICICYNVKIEYHLLQNIKHIVQGVGGLYNEIFTVT